jgi:hypothetical protein
VNQYLSGAHIGIQTAHIVANLFVDYRGDGDLFEWANEHQTIICLNGGDHENLNKIHEELIETDFVCSIFSEPGLNGSFTAVGVIVSEKVYELAAQMRAFPTQRILNESNEWIRYETKPGEGFWKYSDDDLKLISIINSYALAR